MRCVRALERYSCESEFQESKTSTVCSVTAITVEKCGAIYIGLTMKKHFVSLQSSGEALRNARCFRAFGRSVRIRDLKKKRTTWRAPSLEDLKS